MGVFLWTQHIFNRWTYFWLTVPTLVLIFLHFTPCLHLYVTDNDEADQWHHKEGLRYASLPQHAYISAIYSRKQNCTDVSNLPWWSKVLLAQLRFGCCHPLIADRWTDHPIKTQKSNLSRVSLLSCYINAIILQCSVTKRSGITIPKSPLFLEMDQMKMSLEKLGRLNEKHAHNYTDFYHNQAKSEQCKCQQSPCWTEESNTDHLQWSVTCSDGQSVNQHSQQSAK